MNHYICECGRAEYSESGIPPRDCQGCDECGTTFAQHPGDHKPREPHDWKPQFDKDTGKPTRPYCRKCFARGEDP